MMKLKKKITFIDQIHVQIPNGQFSLPKYLSYNPISLSIDGDFNQLIASMPQLEVLFQLLISSEIS